MHQSMHFLYVRHGYNFHYLNRTFIKFVLLKNASTGLKQMLARPKI